MIPPFHSFSTPLSIRTLILESLTLLGLFLCFGVHATAEEPTATIQNTSEEVAETEVTESGVPAKAESATETDMETNSDTEEEILEGHSYHGEVFNEGPRQKAHLMGGVGDVHFAVSTDNPTAQQFFDQGLGQLHGFWYLEAERSFRQVMALDPNCAMAYWGAAMANAKNRQRAQGFIAEAVERLEHANSHEKMYIQALQAFLEGDEPKNKARQEAYLKALEDLILKYPDDYEAKAFLALHLYNTLSGQTSYVAANALLQKIFAKYPMHPAHHYCIHLWDKRHASQALPSAALCGQTSPSIAHMWHMPGHIYSQLKRYPEAAWQQEASARVDHAQMMRYGIMPDQIHNFAHNNEWLIRNLIFLGRVPEAIDLAKNMCELPRHPRYNTFSKSGSAKYGRQRLLQTLRTYELWDELIALENTPYLQPTDVLEEQVKRLRYLGLAYYQTGDKTNGDRQLVALQELEKQVQADLETQKATTKEAEESSEPEEKADPEEKAGADQKDDKSRDLKKDLALVQKNIKALQAHQAVQAEDFTTGFRLLKKAGDADPVYLARLCWQAGDRAQAEKLMRKAVRSGKNEVQPLAALVELLWQAGKKKEAQKHFESLRSLAGAADLDCPVFARLAPIAEELEYPADWRTPQPFPEDFGTRPDLASLGPFRWQPSPAPQWSLPNAQGDVQSSQKYFGRPQLVIFYLGSGCLHCAQQLQAFAPRLPEFEEAGITVLAISSDDREGLKDSIRNYDKGDLPIPLFANPELDVFKAFHAYDDFEEQPLHGTFLISPQGKILWQDISFEPFMETDFLLQEAQRLLAQPSE